MYTKKHMLIVPLLGVTILTAACTEEQSASTALAINNYVTYADEDFYETWQDSQYTTIQLNETEITTNGANAATILVEDQTITLKGAGTYVVQGALTDGQLVVDAAESGTVRIVLNGATINSSTTAAIMVKEADKTVISMEKDTENNLTDGSSREENDEATGAIYAKDDLIINGEGSLTVKANAFDGIVGKDQIIVTGGNLQITAKDDGILGRDLFAMQNAMIDIKAQGDGIKSTNDEDEAQGNIVLESGTLNIEAGHDGIASVKDLIVLDGKYQVKAGGGSPETVSSDEAFFGGMMPGFNGGAGGMQQPPNWGSSDQQSTESTADGQTNQQQAGQMGQPPADAQGGGQMGQPPTDMQGQGQQPTEQQSTDATTTPSTKGLKSGSTLQISGGTLTIDSLDDAIHSDGNVDITDGTITINTGDDGIHANEELTIAGGDLNIEKSYEGLEGKNITIKGGHTELTAADDGVNINGGSSDFGFGQPGQMPTADHATTSENTTKEKVGQLTIEDGYLFVNASGDGLDSNGNIVMLGGTAIVYGPINAGNGALDYDGTFDLQGGTLVAAGSSGMALGVSDSSTQNTVMMTFDSTLEANTTVTVQNTAGEVVAAVAPRKSFQTIVISTPNMQEEGEYTIGYAGTLTDDLENGFSSNGSVKNLTSPVQFTFYTAMTYLDAKGVTEKPSGFGGMGGGFGGGGRGGRPDMQNGTSTQQPPTTTEGQK